MNNPIKFNTLRPMLWTDKLEETIDFYTRNLSFVVGEHNDAWGWAALHRDGVEIMLAKPNQHIAFEKPVFTGSLYIIIENVDQLWEEVKAKVNVCYEIDDFEWQMREFAIYDNNGYILQFGQELI